MWNKQKNKQLCIYFQMVFVSESVTSTEGMDELDAEFCQDEEDGNPPTASLDTELRLQYHEEDEDEETQLEYQSIYRPVKSPAVINSICSTDSRFL
jgi:hypothetical protein